MKLAIDVVLLPPEEVMDEAIKINQKLGPEIKLNKENCFPHTSLCMGILDDKDLEKVKTILVWIAQEFLPMDLTKGKIKTHELPNGKKCLGLDFENSEKLQKLHETIMKKLDPFLTTDGTKEMLYNPEDVEELDLDWINNYKQHLDNPFLFKPHITLGIGKTEEEFKLNTFTSNKLALFQLGSYCTCRKKLMEIEL